MNKKKTQHIPIIVSTLYTIKTFKFIFKCEFPQQRRPNFGGSCQPNAQLAVITSSAVCVAALFTALSASSNPETRATSLDMNNCSVETKWLQNEP